MSDWKSRVDRDMMRTFNTPIAMLTRGEGCHVWDAEGNRYLDFLAGIAVNALGHAHPAFVGAITRQASTLAHVSNYFSSPPQLELAARLKRLAGADEGGRVYFANSGAEANEAAFKLARLNHGDGSRTRVLTLENSFHGRTFGALALTGKPALQEGFHPLPGGVEHIPTTIEALEAAIDDRVAALILEPIKGEAGVIDLPEGYLARARALTEAHGVLLIIDEIQTGAGRTGSGSRSSGTASSRTRSPSPRGSAVACRSAPSSPSAPPPSCSDPASTAAPSAATRSRPRRRTRCSRRSSAPVSCRTPPRAVSSCGPSSPPSVPRSSRRSADTGCSSASA